MMMFRKAARHKQARMVLLRDFSRPFQPLRQHCESHTLRPKAPQNMHGAVVGAELREPSDGAAVATDHDCWRPNHESIVAGQNAQNLLKGGMSGVSLNPTKSSKVLLLRWCHVILIMIWLSPF